MKKASRRFASGSLLAALAALTLGSSGPIDPAAYYRGAVTHMRSMPEPNYVQYTTVVHGNDGTIVVSRDDRGEAQVALVSSSPIENSWPTAYRTSDRRASVELPDGTYVVSRFPLFDPTWNGAFEWLRHGMAAAMEARTPEPSSSPEPSPLTSPSATEPPLVAIVTAIDVSYYAIGDGGAATCPSGTQARRLELRAKDDALAHPLTEAIVDDATQRFCALRFHEHLASPKVTFDADIELRFAQAGRYYLIRGGTIAGAVRPVKRPGWFRIDAAFAFVNVTFPESLPAARFEPGVTEPETP